MEMVGWGSEQCGLVEDVPAYGRGCSEMIFNPNHSVNAREGCSPCTSQLSVPQVSDFNPSC